MDGNVGYNMASLSDGIVYDYFDSLSGLQSHIEGHIELIPNENFLKSTKVKLEIKRR